MKALSNKDSKSLNQSFINDKNSPSFKEYDKDDIEERKSVNLACIMQKAADSKNVSRIMKSHNNLIDLEAEHQGINAQK